MGKKGRNNPSNHRSNPNTHFHGKKHHEIEEPLQDQSEKYDEENDGEDGEAEEDEAEIISSTPISVRIFLWEFGQNDPKRYLSILLR